MDESNVIVQYLRDIPGLLSSPLGVLGIVAMLVYVAYCLFGKGGKWLAVTVLLVVGIIAKDENATTQTVMIPALEALRSSNRAVFGLTLILLVLRRVLGGEQRWRHETIPKSVVWLGCLQVLFGLGWIAEYDIARGGGNIMLSVLLVGGLAGMVGTAVRSLADIRSVFRAAEVAGLLFCAMSLAQLMLNPVGAYLAGRFEGISANPQFAAIFTAILLNIAVYMTGTPTEAKFLRIAHFVCAIIFASFMMWTGSRTGFVITVVGLAVQLHRRPWMLLLAASGGFLAMRLLTSTNEYAVNSVDRLTSAADTGRPAEFVMAWAYFLQYPVFGRAIAVIENCYLAVAVNTGMVGLVFLFLCGYAHLQNVVFIWKHRRWLGKEARLVDLLVAWSLALFGASFFEGFVLAIATAATVFVILLLTLTALVKEHIEIAAESAQTAGYPTAGEAQPVLT